MAITASNVVNIDRPRTASERKAISIIAENRDLQINSAVHNDNEIHESSEAAPRNLLSFLLDLSEVLKDSHYTGLSYVLTETIHQATAQSDFGGYGLSSAETALSASEESDVLFLLAAYTEALNCAERAAVRPKPLTFRPSGRRGMTMTEKILAMHDVEHKGWVKPGDVVQVDIDWVLASELSWAGMESVYEGVGRPGIFRNDRFWLAGDHRVEPELYDKPQVRALMKKSERARDEFRMTEFQGFNYTILHTEFVRSRAQPGMLCIGADSHTCSAGAVSCLAIGMGGADVCIPLITGQTWFSVPETVQFKLVNKPPRGVGGKDTVLYLLGQFKRNTVAADRVAEFTGSGVAHLSCDARFAIANMCTEFGAVSGIFDSDQRTLDFINRRRAQKHKDLAVYFKADEDAQYAASFEIDLSKVESFVALYPSPDNVVPVSEVAGRDLDGTFIGACTTAEEDLIIGALILKAGLDNGMKPVAKGRRIVVPGSRPIRHKMEKLGLIDVYERAGFKVGIPGCSMCVGQGVDQAASGEKWLSSQNRNFPNRMGPGSIANLASAATVAASSFEMKITNPRQLLDAIDMDKLEDYLEYQPFEIVDAESPTTLHYSEPYGTDQEAAMTQISKPMPHGEATISDQTGGMQNSDLPSEVIQGRVIRLGDFIDTDAIAPSKFLASCTTNESLGAHCMEFFMPEFRKKVKAGQNIIVAGSGFGCGSSREVAVNALLGAGVQCVIAKSFAFIYARNQPNIGLLGVTIADSQLFELAQAGDLIEVDVEKSEVRCKGLSFPFQLSNMEKQLIAAGGLTQAFQKFGKHLFDIMCRPKASKPRISLPDIENIKA